MARSTPDGTAGFRLEEVVSAEAIRIPGSPVETTWPVSCAMRAASRRPSHFWRLPTRVSIFIARRAAIRRQPKPTSFQPQMRACSTHESARQHRNAVCSAPLRDSACPCRHPLRRQLDRDGVHGAQTIQDVFSICGSKRWYLQTREGGAAQEVKQPDRPDSLNLQSCPERYPGSEDQTCLAALWRARRT